MGKKKICFVAQFPPPMHGLTKAVDTLYNSELAQEFDFEKIDTTDNKRILQTLVAIRRSSADLFYFTIAQSIGANLRCLIEETQGGLVCEPGDYEQVDKNIWWFIDHTGSEELTEMGERSRAYLVENLTKDVSIKKYIEAIKDL